MLKVIVSIPKKRKINRTGRRNKVIQTFDLQKIPARIWQQNIQPEQRGKLFFYYSYKYNIKKKFSNQLSLWTHGELNPVFLHAMEA